MEPRPSGAIGQRGATCATVGCSRPTRQPIPGKSQRRFMRPWRRAHPRLRHARACRWRRPLSRGGGPPCSSRGRPAGASPIRAVGAPPLRAPAGVSARAARRCVWSGPQSRPHLHPTRLLPHERWTDVLPQQPAVCPHTNAGRTCGHSNRGDPHRPPFLPVTATGVLRTSATAGTRTLFAGLGFSCLCLSPLPSPPVADLPPRR